ncbi:MAG: SDR family oxidoreductase [Chloroflexi bacterium]|nr:SDR family oxidoreductase [Chloroflexota bacterium]
MELSNKVAIVTGGGRGIGKAIALAFAREGAKLVVASRTVSEVEETAREIESAGGCAVPERVDVSEYREVGRMVDAALRRWGKVDVLVNDAGVQGPLGPVAENSIDRWVSTFQVNMFGTFFCVRAVLPFMMQRKSGKIINMSGGGSTSPRPYFTAYAASKTAVVRFTESVAEEVKPFNIQVNAIAPGAVNTTMVRQVLAAGPAVGKKESTAARRQMDSGGTPPEKAADLAVFLASSKSDGLTGRLISAVWDNWQDMTPARIDEIMSSELYTLRRVVK